MNFLYCCLMSALISMPIWASDVSDKEIDDEVSSVLQKVFEADGDSESKSESDKVEVSEDKKDIVKDED
ncbi:hypothetical protein P618_201155 [Holospora obtusa F1]|uniref:Uncharacterized protein n=2 Tax=Holospora obtusa TaxID=49893 RepID=W6TD84_HOLOB|nr:hypothetical protein [Holospora obtusa]ETZ06681.1 hypothetical protein P618_201155 [Holospora obtusa F1]BAA14044.1 5.4 kDa peptide [Holospora obtusa]